MQPCTAFFIARNFAGFFITPDSYYLNSSLNL